jgi:hypothetical protein
MIKPRILLAMFFCTLTIQSIAQVESTYQVSYEPKVQNLINNCQEIAENKKGWNIQLLSTVDRSELEYQLNKFGDLYPALQADWVHDRPYYKVNVGAFLKREDAIRVLHIVQQEFPSAVCKRSNALPKTLFLN